MIAFADGFICGALVVMLWYLVKIELGIRVMVKLKIKEMESKDLR